MKLFKNKKVIMVLSLLTVVFFAGCSNSNEPDGPGGPVGGGYQGGGKMLSYKVPDVSVLFAGLNTTGKHREFDGLYGYTNHAAWGWSKHVQGYAQANVDGQTWHFFTNSGHNKGMILISNPANQTSTIEISGWSHPGGMQTIGNYLFVPMEQHQDGRKNVEVWIYNVANGLSKDSKPIKQIKFGPDSSRYIYGPDLAGALGITDFNYNGKDYYLMVIARYDQFYTYIAEVPQNMANVSFKFAGVTRINGKETQGFGLITDDSNGVYMILTMSYYSAGEATYADWAYLHKLSIDSTAKGFSVDINTPLDTRRFYKTGGLKGVDGPHFRWAGGVYIHSSGLRLLTTSRNILNGKLDVNYYE